ncbi:MAG TPA: carbonic anhydrase, partial [Candidatus Methylomirabilis sp.]|nr:carbonic anhydrase [Candidatus Methylomirabilis sp.]
MTGSSLSLSRRNWIRLTGTAVVGLAAARAMPAGAAEPGKAASVRDPAAVWRALLDGNKRFANGRPTIRRRPADFAALAAGQAPEAVIVGCADSRVPPELVFDQGVGDLFVVRVAGNVVSGTGFIVKSSIEYAVLELKVPLIVVLGHSGCGAIKAALQHLDSNDSPPGSIKELVDALRATAASAKDKPGNPLDNAIRANVEAGVARLKALDPIVAPAVKAGQVGVTGAVYELRTGIVTP